MRFCIRQKDQRLLHHIPVINKDQDCYRAQRSFTERHTYIFKNLPFSSSIDLRCLHHRFRDPSHILGQKEYRKGRKNTRQPDSPPGIQYIQPFTDQIVWYQRYLIRHQHQDNINKENAFLQPASVSGKPIGGASCY